MHTVGGSTGDDKQIAIKQYQPYRDKSLFRKFVCIYPKSLEKVVKDAIAIVNQKYQILYPSYDGDLIQAQKNYLKQKLE